MTSSDHLRTRIAAVLDQHKTDPYDEWTCQCNSTGIRWAAHVADAVIRELKMEREHWQYGDGHTMGVRYRFVTDWIANE